MEVQKQQTLSIAKLAFSIVGGIVTSVLVALSDWQASDLLWAIWSSSLVVGYGVLIFMVLAEKIKTLQLKENSPDNTFLSHASDILHVTFYFALMHMIVGGTFDAFTQRIISYDMLLYSSASEIVVIVIKNLALTIKEFAWFIVCAAITNVPLLINYLRGKVMAEELLWLTYLTPLKMAAMMLLLIPLFMTGLSSPVALIAVVFVSFMPLSELWQLYEKIKR